MRNTQRRKRIHRRNLKNYPLRKLCIPQIQLLRKYQRRMEYKTPTRRKVNTYLQGMQS